MLEVFFGMWMRACPACDRDEMMQYLFPRLTLSCDDCDEVAVGEPSLASLCEVHGIPTPSTCEDARARAMSLGNLLLRVVCDLLMRDKVICRIRHPQEEGIYNFCWKDNALRQLVANSGFLTFVEDALGEFSSTVASGRDEGLQVWRTLFESWARNDASPEEIKALFSTEAVLREDRVTTLVSAVCGRAKALAILLVLECLKGTGAVSPSLADLQWDETPLTLLKWSLTADSASRGEGHPADRSKKGRRIHPFYLFVDSWVDYSCEHYQLLCDHLIPWQTKEVRDCCRHKDRYSRFVAGEAVVSWFLQGWHLPCVRGEEQENVKVVRKHITQAMLELVQRQLVISCIPAEPPALYRQKNALRALADDEIAFSNFVELVVNRLGGCFGKGSTEQKRIDYDIAAHKQEWDIAGNLQRSTPVSDTCDLLVAHVKTFAYLACIAITGAYTESPCEVVDTPSCIDPPVAPYSARGRHDIPTVERLHLVERRNAGGMVKSFVIACDTITGSLSANDCPSQHAGYLQIGREGDSDLLFHDYEYKGISRAQARIRYQRGSWTISEAPGVRHGVALRKRDGTQVDLSDGKWCTIEEGDTIHAIFGSRDARGSEDGVLRIDVLRGS